ncbi:hypothetical protein MVEN_02428000 [Mycena venus]|uniref:TFIIS N-terminal domain-containing protein n=1 Tax=Mycena venus TaxID=2733690 RepID=A0A8H6WY92_9AGAR|nr:hypothetical protein MVEN_02428000 [Mycena venus]
MESSIYSWLQPESPHHPVHHSPPPTQDWQKQGVPQNGPGSSAASPQATHQQPTLDLSDFTTLADLPGVSAAPIPRNPSLNGLAATSTSSTAASSPPSAPSSFYSFTGHPGFYGNGASSYYVSPWAATQPSQSPDPIPLSNYSTLNGATSTNTASSSQQQQQQQQSSQMMIDPALTTMNGSTSNGTHHTYSQQSSYSSQTNTPQQQQQQQQQQRQPQITPYSFLPSFSMAYYLPPQQQQQQGTLSPQALHAPATNSLMNAYYTQPQASGSKPQQQQQQQQQQPQVQQQPQQQQPPAPPPGPSPAERRQQMLTAIRPLLQANAFTGAAAVATLATRLFDYGSADVDAATRMEILTKIRDGAGNHYFRAWAENPTAVDITREWLKAAFNATRESGDDAQLGETIMPLLHLIDRLPMTVESLKTSKLGKIVVKLVKDPPTPAIKDMAFNVERRWRQMVTEKQPESAADDSKSKKRKIADTPARALPPLKKAATGTARPIAAKKEPVAAASKTAAPAVKDAKSDSSFFSAPKPKPKLPSFKKAPPAPVKKEEGANVAQPSAIDPFQEVLKSMKARKGSPLTGVMSTPSPHGSAERSGSTSAAEAGPSAANKLGKRKKSVTWAPEGKLESIRLIERAVYGDENTDVSAARLYLCTGAGYGVHSLRDLDRSEGAALHMHLFEETVDWSEPLREWNILPLRCQRICPIRGERGSQSEEKTTQEQREQTALVSLYMSPSSIPDSPAEPSVIIPDEDVDKDVREMTTGPEVDTVFWSGPPIPVDPPQAQPGVPPLTSVADLVGQLAGGAAANPSTAPTDPAAVMQALPPEQLQHLLAQLSQLPPAQQLQQQMHMQMQQQPPYGDWPGLNQFSADYSQPPAFQDDGGERNGWSVGRGGRGRGRGRGRGGAGGDDGYRHNKKRLCNFFAAGRRAQNQISKTGPKTDYASVISDANTEINAILATKCHNLTEGWRRGFVVVY